MASQLNIDGLVASIRDTSVYTAIIEAISNSIHSIDERGVGAGTINIELIRDNTPLLASVSEESESSLPDITSVKITDDGVGFNDNNLKYFDEAYTRHKLEIGGKGFGRFVYLKHFYNVSVDSVYENAGKKRRTFGLGRTHEIVFDLKDEDAGDSAVQRTTLYLNKIKEGALDKKVETVSRRLLERTLVQFIREDKDCPIITVFDDYTGKKYVLNELLGDSKYSEIQKIDSELFNIETKKGDFNFQLHVFKIWFGGNQQSKIALTSHYLEVTETPIDEYVNEFESGFVGEIKERNGETVNRFIIRAYVTGDYLDTNVERERVGFQFGKKADGVYPLGRVDIESKVAEILKDKYQKHFQTQRKKKEERLETVTNDKPWLKKYASQVDLTTLKVGASSHEAEIALETVRLQREQQLDEDIERIVKSDVKVFAEEKAEELIRDLAQSNKDDLARYVARRKVVIDILDKSLKADASGKPAKEKVVHDLVYPMQTDSDNILDDYQNLWLLDERLNYTEFISSDKQLGAGNADRTDLFVFHHQVAFRAGEEKQNPITIVEFKRPGKDDFAVAGHKDNPVDQIVRYTNAIREGKYKKPGKRPIYTDENTQFYGYIVIDFTEKVRKWLDKVEDFDVMPDGLGYFKWKQNINLYIEVLSWDKVLKDAKLRNSIFTRKLGLKE